MNHAHWTNKEETFYSYATGNIYYTMQKNYNEVKSRKPLAVCAVFNFLKSNIQNTLHPSSYRPERLCLSWFQEVKGTFPPFITVITPIPTKLSTKLIGVKTFSI